MDPRPPALRGDVAPAAAAIAPAPEPAEASAPLLGLAPRALDALALTLEPADLAELRRHRRIRELSAGRPTARKLHAAIHDTARRDLLRRGLLLEVRRAGRRFVQTVRSVASDAPSGEAPLGSPAPRLDRITPAALRERVRDAVGDQPLHPVLELEVSRSRRSLRAGASELALEIDVGELRTARGSTPLCELSLRGIAVDGEAPLEGLYALARELQRDVRLRIATQSPLERGVQLLEGAAPPPQRAKRVRLAPDATLEEAIEAALRSAIAQILANEAPARLGADAEGVHQMRVGVRRLRSALALFRDFLPAEAVAPLREELRWLAGELGAARDLDVFHEETLRPLCRLRPGDPHLEALATRIAALRSAAQRRVSDALDSLRYAELMLSLGHFVHARAWREQPLTPESAKLFQPAAETARLLLSRRRRKLRRRARGLARAGDAERHALRIQTKKLRYAAEFLRGLFPGRGAKGFLARTRAVQDPLGHLNDTATTRRLLELALAPEGRSADTEDAELLRAASFVEGWSARGALQALDGLDEAVRRLLERRPFWEGA